VLLKSGEPLSETVRRFSQIMGQITAERSRQEQKWGQQDHDFPHYYQILNEELGEVSNAYLEAGYAARAGEPAIADENRENMRTEMIQCAAVMVAMIECGDRIGWWRR
jgi:hypothetical protein